MEKRDNPFELNEYTPKALDTSLKSGFKTVMSNIGTLLAIMCVMLLVAIFLFDVQLEEVTAITAKAVYSLVADAVITVILYICMQNSMILNGEKNGRLDSEFISARSAVVELRERFKKLGYPRMGEFCDAYVAAELCDVRRRRLAKIPLKYGEWERAFGSMSRRDIKKLPRRFKYVTDDGRERVLIITKKIRVILINVAQLEEQRFTPEMMMYDDTHHSWRRRPLMPSPEEKIVEKRRANYPPTIIFAVMTAFLLFKFITSPSWSTAIYCAFKLFGLLWRGGTGYSIGFLAYSVHGVKYYHSQEVRFNEYDRWLEAGGNEDVFDF